MGKADIDFYQLALEEIIKPFHVISCRKTLYYYDEKEGIYKEDSGFINSKIQFYLLENYAINTQKCSICEAKRQVLSYIQDEEPLDEYPFNKHPDALPLKNGVLKFDFSAGEFHLEPYSHKYLFTYKLPVIFNPDAKSERMKEYLLSLDVNPEKLLQIPAHVLLAATGRQFKTAYLCIGGPDSGKSTFLNMLIEKVFGRENCESIPLQTLLIHNFMAAQLENKIANVYADLPSLEISDIGRFKALTGDDYIQVERKYHDPYKIKNKAVFIFSANEFPKIRTYDKGWWPRWIIIKFPKEFPVNSEFSKIFTDEAVSALFNMILRKMQDIMMECSIRRDDPEMVENEWLKAVDLVYRYKSERLQKDLKHWEFKDGLLSDFVDYCDKIGELSLTREEFFKRLRKFGGKPFRPRSQGEGRDNCFLGWRILGQSTGGDIDSGQGGQGILDTTDMGKNSTTIERFSQIPLTTQTGPLLTKGDEGPNGSEPVEKEIF